MYVNIFLWFTVVGKSRALDLSQLIKDAEEKTNDLTNAILNTTPGSTALIKVRDSNEPPLNAKSFFTTNSVWHLARRTVGNRCMNTPNSETSNLDHSVNRQLSIYETSHETKVNFSQIKSNVTTS